MHILRDRSSVTLRCPAAADSSRCLQILSGGADRLWEDGASAIASCAALSFSADDPDILSANLHALGFDSISLSGYDNTDPARIGAAFAAIKSGSDALIAVILRGTQGAEWFSNFRIGFAEEHRGFSFAADDAEKKLVSYLRANIGQGNVRFLITGYSRGGAAANLLARRLCDRLGADSVRCVTFGAPNTALKRPAARYDCIQNVVRREDFFTRVPLEQWGYTKYGEELVPGELSGGDYRASTGEEYIGFSDPGAVDAVLSAVGELAPNVPAYYRRRYPVGERMMSLYDFMLTVAGMLSDQPDEDAGEVIFDSMASQFADLSAFLSAGADITELLSPAAGIPRCSVADSHSPAAYLAALSGAGIIVTSAGEGCAAYSAP